MKIPRVFFQDATLFFSFFSPPIHDRAMIGDSRCVITYLNVSDKSAGSCGRKALPVSRDFLLVDLLQQPGGVVLIGDGEVVVFAHFRIDQVDTVRTL